ncbi:SDR family oxidoreductase [Chloroflexota bacterium]
MPNNLYIITGANTGIGKAIAHGLAERGLPILMVCRSFEKGQRAQAEIQAATGDASIDLLIGDLSCNESVRALADAILARREGIAALIHNAGIWQRKLQFNPDGIELTFAINHLAPFLLTHLLLDRLIESAPSRVVNVNAGLYTLGRLDLERTPRGKDFSPLRTYPTSKLANVLFTRQMARRLAGSNVTINAVHPGVIRTNLGVLPGGNSRMARLFKFWMKSPQHGAQGPIFLATSPQVAAVSGAFYDELKPKEYTPAALDDKLSEGLWHLSEQVTGLVGS